MSDTTAGGSGYDWESMLGAVTQRTLNRWVDVETAKHMPADVMPGYVPDMGTIYLTGARVAQATVQLLPLLLLVGVGVVLLRKAL